MSKYKRQSAVGLAAFFVLCMAVYSLYLQGIASPFIFDDYATLSRLSISNWHDFQQFLFSNQSGPTGRPISMLTFAADDAYWPSSPGDFKHSNLLFHIIAGLLLFWLLNLLFEDLLEKPLPPWLAFIGTVYWMTAPMHVSTVLYVVQRMTILSAIFCFSAGILYLKFRQAYKSGGQEKRSLLLLLFAYTSVALGCLAKENAVTFGFFFLCVELISPTVKQPGDRATGWRATVLNPLVVLAAVLPAFLVVYHVVKFDSMLLGYAYRPYSFEEKMTLLPVAYWQYVLQFFSLDHSLPSIYHDDFVAKHFQSKGYIWIAWASLLMAVVMIARWGRRFPFFVLGLSCFLLLHSLEMGPVPIEPYFEHRNYLPSMGLVIVLLGCLLWAWENLRILCKAAVPLLLVINLFYLQLALKGWSDLVLMSYTWSIEHRDSKRAQYYYAHVLDTIGLPKHATKVHAQIIESFDRNLGSYINLIRIRCGTGEDVSSFVVDFENAANSKPYDRAVLYAFERFSDSTMRDCLSEHERGVFLRAMEITAENPVLKGKKKDAAKIHYLVALAYAKERNFGKLMYHLDAADRYAPTTDMALIRARWLLEGGLVEQAAQALAIAYQRDNKRKMGLPTKKKEIDVLWNIIPEGYKNESSDTNV